MICRERMACGSPLSLATIMFELNAADPVKRAHPRASLVSVV
jgi:hypothetical protein